MVNVIIAFRNFVNVPKIDYKLRQVRLSVRMEYHELQRTNFCENKHLGFILLICRHVTVLFKI